MKEIEAEVNAVKRAAAEAGAAVQSALLIVSKRASRTVDRMRVEGDDGGLDLGLLFAEVEDLKQKVALADHARERRALACGLVRLFDLERRR